MKRPTLFSISALALLCVLPSTASAEGGYVGLFGGYSSTDDLKFETGLGQVTSTVDSSFGFGFNGGYEFTNLRLEGEISRREGDVNDHILGGTALPGSTGKTSSWALMGNVYYDFNRQGTVSPYLGVGIGYADVELDNFGVEPIPAVLEDSAGGFAYQFIGGLGFTLSDSWDLLVDYRYFAADGLSVTVTDVAGGVSSDVDYSVQTINAGFRYSFN